MRELLFLALGALLLPRQPQLLEVVVRFVCVRRGAVGVLLVCDEKRTKMKIGNSLLKAVTRLTLLSFVLVAADVGFVGVVDVDGGRLEVPVLAGGRRGAEDGVVGEHERRGVRVGDGLCVRKGERVVVMRGGDVDGCAARRLLVVLGEDAHRGRPVLGATHRLHGQLLVHLLDHLVGDPRELRRHLVFGHRQTRTARRRDQRRR